MTQPLACRQCGAQHPRVSGADLVCTDVCRKAATVERAIVEEQLLIAGFVRVPDVHGLWEKGNVHLTADQCLHEGIEKALEKHGDALYQRG